MQPVSSELEDSPCTVELHFEAIQFKMLGFEISTVVRLLYDPSVENFPVMRLPKSGTRSHTLV